jgi:hypothetical protein
MIGGQRRDDHSPRWPRRSYGLPLGPLAAVLRACPRSWCPLCGRVTLAETCLACGRRTDPLAFSAYGENAFVSGTLPTVGRGGQVSFLEAPILSVTYTGEPDVAYEFVSDGQRMYFGRDEDQCEIVIWSAINGRELSRVAGCVWRMDDELWVRNLSMRHELYLQMLGRPAEQPLPPRRDDGVDRGPARAIPGTRAFLRAPGGCELAVRQLGVTFAATLTGSDDDLTTVRVPAVPAELRLVAAALCEPLLDGRQLPGSYAQIARRTASPSVKRIRTQVGQLCALYAAEVPALAVRVGKRIQREMDELGLSSDRRLQGGIWIFDRDAAMHRERAETQRSALALPDYFEIAHLLVRRQLITVDDLDDLPAPDNT